MKWALLFGVLLLVMVSNSYRLAITMPSLDTAQHPWRDDWQATSASTGTVHHPSNEAAADTADAPTVSVAASASSTALDAHSQSSAPRKVHANHSHAAITTTLSNTNADAATTTTTEAEPIVPRLVPSNVSVVWNEGGGGEPVDLKVAASSHADQSFTAAEEPPAPRRKSLDQQELNVLDGEQPAHLFSLWPNFSCEPPAMQDPRPLQFIHIPKTAGSTLEIVAASHNVSWGYCLWPHDHAQVHNGGFCPTVSTPLRRMPPGALSRISPHHMPIQYAYHRQLKHKMESWFLGNDLFAVVRNPYTRILSQWSYGNGHHRAGRRIVNDAALMNEKVQKWASIVLNTIHTAQRPGDLPLAEYFTLDAHLVRQIDFVSNLQQHGIDGKVTVLRMENLSHEFDCLLRSHKLDWKLPSKRSNPSAGALTVTNFTAKTRELVAKAYADDFKYFGYEI
jgi:hypothetical protein